MPTITVRAIDPATNEPLQGNGQNNFLSDLEAVTQIIRTRLLLFQGEWFLNLLDGLPLFQSILGSSGSPNNIQVVIGLISQRISSFTPYVTGISSLTATFQNRRFSYNAVIDTIFGKVYVSNNPGNSATLLS